MKKKGAATELDKYVGARLKEARNNLGLTQIDLAASLNVTFQQVQKYEKGANRISAVTLYKISEVLDLSMYYFFPGWIDE